MGKIEMELFWERIWNDIGENIDSDETSEKEQD